jgi:hypothetical protein
MLLGAATAAVALMVVLGLVYVGSRRNSPEHAVGSFLTLIQDGKCEEAMELMSSGARRWVTSLYGSASFLCDHLRSADEIPRSYRIESVEKGSSEAELRVRITTLSEQEIIRVFKTIREDGRWRVIPPWTS